MHTASILTNRFAWALIGTLSGSTIQAHADGRHPAPDHELARQALDRGEVRPIVDILALVAQTVPGEVIEVEFDDAEDLGDVSWHYELKILADDSHVREVRVDAATGRILTVEED